ncbi:MAG: tRNA-dihydrouridine synthase [Solobacterium sp.]|nr:tRNA-dihydrouridine synthase [Solobacterium sp.]
MEVEAARLCAQNATEEEIKEIQMYMEQREEYAKAMEEVGVSAIAVHGRTRAQMYEGKSNNAYSKMVK